MQSIASAAAAAVAATTTLAKHVFMPFHSIQRCWYRFPFPSHFGVCTTSYVCCCCMSVCVCVLGMGWVVDIMFPQLFCSSLLPSFALFYYFLASSTHSIEAIVKRVENYHQMIFFWIRRHLRPLVLRLLLLQYVSWIYLLHNRKRKCFLLASHAHI